MITVRLATLGDLDDIFKIATEHIYNEALVELAPINPTKVMHYLVDIIAMKMFFVAMKDDEIIGVAAMQPQRWWFSDAVYLEDLFIYVLPEHRTSPAADALMKAIKKVAEKGGMLVQLSIINGHDLSRKAEYYKKKGFIYVGGIFVNIDFIGEGSS